MRTNIRKINKYRKFLEDFKRNLVEEFGNGKFSVRELGKLSDTSIYNWIYKYSTSNKRGSRIVEME